MFFLGALRASAVDCNFAFFQEVAVCLKNHTIHRILPPWQTTEIMAVLGAVP
jgi:hypothetical protein